MNDNHSNGAHESNPPSIAKDPPLARRILGMVPTLLVLVALFGVAYAGHEFGWTVPKFSKLFGDADNDDDAEWCNDHGVPKGICVECDESLLPRTESTWCETHGVHNCPFERPEVVQTKSTPDIRPDDRARAALALALKPRKENSEASKLHERRIQVASDKILHKMGIEVSPVKREPIVESISASGEVSFEQPRVIPISSAVAGRVWMITDNGTLGAAVQRGDVLALLDSAEVGKAKAELLQAYAQVELRKKTLDRLNSLSDTGSVSLARISEAETALREARIRLTGSQQTLNNMGLPIRVDEKAKLTSEELTEQVHFFGIPREITAGLNAKTTTANLTPLIAARAGSVITVKAALGEMTDPGKPLFIIADASRMWLTLNVRNEDMHFVRVRDAKKNRPGQQVMFRVDGAAEEVTGELVWKSAEVDEKTRTVQVRAELPNPEGKLLANSYGTGRILLRDEKDAVVVSSEAIHWAGDCHVVFVQDKNFDHPGAPKVFHVRNVRPGVTNRIGNESYTEILAGVVPGELVAGRNSYALRGELLKSTLGGD
ncbi:MAG TPA: efflux RND transporter periplasmic adaptor subunit [Gemmataceae bacterium]|nr:efflux RND transporter periplasmic adaptor subunit [Gemmataceae bacterium]